MTFQSQPEGDTLSTVRERTSATYKDPLMKAGLLVGGNVTLNI